MGQAQSVPENAFAKGAQVQNNLAVENPPELDLVLTQTAPLSQTGKHSTSHRSLTKMDSKSSLHLKDQLFFSQDNRNQGASLMPKNSVHNTLASPREIATALPQARRMRKTINHDEEDEDLLEYEERKDLVDDLVNCNPLSRKSLLQMRHKKSTSALSQRSSSAKKLPEQT